MKDPRIGCFIVAVGLVLLINLIKFEIAIVTGGFSRRSYSDFTRADQEFYVQFSIACDEVLRSFALGANECRYLVGDECDQLPKIIRRFGVEKVFIQTNSVKMDFSGRICPFDVVWHKLPGSDWVLSSHAFKTRDLYRKMQAEK